MPEIFISYRRDDSRGATGRLADKLVQQFGAEQVFRDLDAIEAGANFQRAIVDAVRAASVILVIIGRTWADVRTADGRRRLDDPDDYVRREIETALSANIQVVPVLVEGANMPKSDALPDSLHPLALRQAFELSDTRWGYRPAHELSRAGTCHRTGDSRDRRDKRGDLRDRPVPQSSFAGDRELCP
jgi:hypothetical protein